METLQKMPLKELFRDLRPIIYVSANSSLESTLKTLKDNSIVSLPVVDTFSNSVIGVVDMVDIAGFIVDHYPSVDNITPQQLRDLELDGIRFARETSIHDVINYVTKTYKKSSDFFPISSSKSLLQLMERFAIGFAKVPVLNEEDKLVQFVSQSDLLRYLAQNIYLIGDKATTSLVDVGIGQNAVTFVREDIMVVSAVKIMCSNGLSAVPVVDVYGRLAGNFSTTDLRGLGPGDFHSLLLPLNQYLATSHPKSLYPLTCRPTDSLEYAIFKLVATKVHQLWCISDDRKVVGTVTILDLLKLFLGISSEMLQ